ncbi:MAG: response regulator [Candidatus Ozemobacteraceae bacterium]
MSKSLILLVEDEALTAMYLQTSLISLGYDVPAIASKGEDAIRLTAELHPDLVLMDITLSGSMNGIQAAAAIRKASGTPVVFLTAHSDDETLRHAKLSQPFGFLPKPCNMGALKTTIEMALYKSSAEREREKLIIELQEALAKVKILSGLLPICASCKKIRDDRGYWQQIEVYIRDHSDAEFSHGICPECSQKLIAEFSEKPNP